MRKKLATDFKTSNVGRQSSWTKDQQAIIDNSLPAWYKFALIDNKNKKGRDAIFTKWKQEEADRILNMAAFNQLPSGVSLLVEYVYQLIDIFCI